MLIPLALLTLVPAAPDSPSVTDRATAVVMQKAKMPNRYMLKFRAEARMPTPPPPHELEWSANFYLWRDGNKLRVDQFDSQSTPPRQNQDPRNRQIACQNCEREGYGIMTTVLPGSPFAQHLVEFHRFGSFVTEVYCTAFDWRYLGLSNADTCQYKRLHSATNFTSFFGLPGIDIKSKKRDGLSCLVASRKVALNNTEWSVWLSESDDFNPVFFEEKGEVQGALESRTTEISWQQTAGGHRFPKMIKHNTIVSIGTTKTPSEQVVTITHADFDSPIDPAVFTVASFGLNENQVIGYPELEFKDQPRWKNGQVDYSETAGKQKSSGGNPAAGPSAAAPYPTQSNYTLVIGIIAAVLAVGTAVAALVIRRRRDAV